jgi:hypothetical protein
MQTDNHVIEDMMLAILKLYTLFSATSPMRLAQQTVNFL